MRRFVSAGFWGIAFISLATLLSGCSHNLEIKNRDLYTTAIQLTPSGSKPNVAVLPFSGTPDDMFFFNALVRRISQSPAVGELRTDYISYKAAESSFQPDLILSIAPSVTYRSSGWNFLINWPGFLIFTPSWNGYIYRADVVTDFIIHDGEGRMLSSTTLPMSYNIRHAAMNRTIFTGLTWLEVSALAFFSGIYNAFVFDRNILGTFQIQVKDNYLNYVANQMQPKVRAAAEAVGRPLTPQVGEGPEPEVGPSQQPEE